MAINETAPIAMTASIFANAEIADLSAGATDTLPIGAGATAPGAKFTQVKSTTHLLASIADCYAAGTHILTTWGEMLVESLQAGDMAVLATGGGGSIVWVGRRGVRNANPVRIMAGAFGPELPTRDLVLSPEHALFLDGHLIPAHALVDGISVVQEAWDCVIYYHVELERHGLLLAEGLAAESYLDTGNRASFSNGVLASPSTNFTRGDEPAEMCAPLALTGPVVETQRAKLQTIALKRGWAAA